MKNRWARYAISKHHLPSMAAQALLAATLVVSVTLLSTLLMSASPLAAAESKRSAVTKHGAHGVHGMVLFGENALFASHLPLYAHPHDRQVLLRLRIHDPALAQSVREELRAGTQLTLEPEHFDLLRLDPSAEAPLQRFKGRLYRGHFERGGSFWRETELEVERTVVFRPLLSNAPKPTQTYYIAFRDRDIVYLVHQIHGRPDFDHIASVRGRGVRTVPSTSTSIVALPRADHIESALGRPPGDAQWLAARGWRDMRELYFETTDLR
jgi:hypothetical protein